MRVVIGAIVVTERVTAMAKKATAANRKKFLADLREHLVEMKDQADCREIDSN